MFSGTPLKVVHSVEVVVAVDLSVTGRLSCGIVMTPRICICCGEPMAKRGHWLSRRKGVLKDERQLHSKPRRKNHWPLGPELASRRKWENWLPVSTNGTTELEHVKEKSWGTGICDCSSLGKTSQPNKKLRQLHGDRIR